MEKRNIKCEKRGQGEVCVVFSGRKKVGYDVYNQRPVYLESEIKEYKNIPKKDVDGKIIKNYKTLSISGYSKNFAGQIYDELIDESQVKITIPKEKVQELVKTWKRWHLNDLKSGTKRQEEALKGFKGRPKGQSYTQDVEFLKKKKLYSDKGYKYGTDWLVEPLPKEVEIKIEEFFKE